MYFFCVQIVAEYQLFKEEMTTKLTENEITIENLREEIEKLTKIQEQQVNQRKKIIRFDQICLSYNQKQSTAKSTLTNGRMPLKGTASKILFYFYC